MSDEVISVVITIAIIALFFVWVPFLDLVCPPCGRFLEHRRLQKKTIKPRASVVAIRD